LKIAIYGATGQVGRHLVAEAAGRGHEVTALSRHDPREALPGGVTWQHGDLDETAGVSVVAAANDAVVTANGPSRRAGEDPYAFVPTMTGVAEAVGSTRLVVVGGAGSLLLADRSRLVDSAGFPAEYKDESLASAAVLAHLQASGPELDWTYLSPAPYFPAGDALGSYVVGVDDVIGDSISGADYAKALVDELETPRHRRQRFTVAAPAN
jgi:putative NADH-flavin reductase